MPHYKDGTLAKEGDVVKGIPYNTEGKEVVGTILDINVEAETCNCKVAFVEIVPQAVGGGIIPILKYDYGEVKAFEKVLDA